MHTLLHNLLSSLRAHIRLSFEDIGIISHPNEKQQYPLPLVIGILMVEATIVVVCLVQLCRFMKYRVFLKKVVHILIVLEMLACMFQAVDIPSVYKRFLHEVTFISCSLLYFSVFLLWVDFYENLKRGLRIRFLQSNSLLLFMCGYACIYLGVWTLIQHGAFSAFDEEWLTSYSIWLHLSFYASVSAGMIQVSYSIITLLRRSHYPILTNRCIGLAKRTSRTLCIVCCCFVFRFFSTLIFVLCQSLPNTKSLLPWDTWLGFLMLYLFDRILPVLAFVILMRRVPSYIGNDNQCSLRGINFS